MRRYRGGGCSADLVALVERAVAAYSGERRESKALRRVSMKNAFVSIAGCALALAVFGAFAAGKRTPWGDPDLQGTYTTDNSIGVPLERPEQFGTRAVLTDEEYAARVSANDAQVAKDENPQPESEFAEDSAANNAPRHWLERPAKPSRATSLIADPPNGRIPALTPEGEQRVAARRAERRRGSPSSYTDFSNYDRCISRGVAGSVLPAIYGNGTKIVQAPGYVVIQNEMIHETRVVPLDGRPHVGAGVREWMGDSRGHFEGDTLVIETTNLNERTGIGGFGNGAVQSADLKLVERLTRVDAKAVRYELTVNDPTIYTRPWTLRLDLDAKPGYEIYEYACHEGNYGLANMLSAARAQERAAAASKP
jgi:hypothetical protein